MPTIKWTAQLLASNGKVVATVTGDRLVVEHKIGTWLPVLVDGDTIVISEEHNVDSNPA